MSASADSWPFEEFALGWVAHDDDVLSWMPGYSIAHNAHLDLTQRIAPSFVSMRAV